MSAIDLVRSPLTGSERVIIPAGGDDYAEAISLNGKFDARLVRDEPSRIEHWDEYPTFAEAKIAALLLSERAQIQGPTRVDEPDEEAEEEAEAADMTEAEWLNRPQYTVAQCRAASAERALTNELHAEHCKLWAIGTRVHGDESPWIIVDAVFVPAGVRAPKSIERYISSGGCRTGPGYGGTWWFKHGLIAEVKAEPQLDLFGAVA